jgi:hypothetical protein
MCVYNQRARTMIVSYHNLLVYYFFHIFFSVSFPSFTFFGPFLLVLFGSHLYPTPTCLGLKYFVVDLALKLRGPPQCDVMLALHLSTYFKLTIIYDKCC